MSLAEKLKPKAVNSDTSIDEVKSAFVQTNTIESAIKHSRGLAKRGFSQSVVRLDNDMEKVLADLKAKYNGTSNQVIIVHALLRLHSEVC
jgi:hypothetical protein